MPELSDAPTLVRCDADGVCGYPAVGTVSTVTLDDLPDTEFLAVMLSPRPVAEDGTFDEDEDTAYLCRHHLVARVETHTLKAARYEAQA